MNLIEQLDWQGDHFTIAGRTFRLQHQATEQTVADAFLFYKDRGQIEQFARFLDETRFRPERVLELGIWDGGSAAFWVETLGLTRYSAIDLQERGDSDYYRDWVTERGQGRVSTHWGVSQTDSARLRTIVAQNDLQPLDLILDDCSHHYAPTLSSFEQLFPLVRPGGWYVIEDWAWALQPAFQRSDHPWGLFPSLHPIAHALTDLCGSRPDVIPSIRIFPDFVAVERGAATVDRLSVDALVARRDRPWPKIAKREIRAAAGRVKRTIQR